MTEDDAALAASLRRLAVPLGGTDDVGPLLALVDDADTVLLGESTHGTREFHRLRAATTRALIESRGVDAIALEADWPDALGLARHVLGGPAAPSLASAFAGFARFPRWMWRNREMLDFVDWLRRHNDARPAGHPRIGIYGLDLYSLQASMHAVIRHLQRHDPEAARAARERYGCLDGYVARPEDYARAVHTGLTPDCEREVVAQWRARATEALAAPHGDDGDAAFHAEGHARVVAGAERYYRTLLRGRTAAWNVRDEHMAETLAALRRHLAARLGRPARVVVWAHNSHVGDARATEMGAMGQITLGQRVRERAGDFGSARLVGLSTHHGHVMAADDWDGLGRRQPVQPALAGSFEALLHGLGLQRLLLPLADAPAALQRPRLQRAIGVLYRPATERFSHYLEAALPRQFDAWLHLDETEAVAPLGDDAGTGDAEEPPETYPSGL